MPRLTYELRLQGWLEWPERRPHTAEHMAAPQRAVKAARGHGCQLLPRGRLRRVRGERRRRNAARIALQRPPARADARAVKRCVGAEQLHIMKVLRQRLRVEPSNQRLPLLGNSTASFSEQGIRGKVVWGQCAKDGCVEAFDLMLTGLDPTSRIVNSDDIASSKELESKLRQENDRTDLRQLSFCVGGPLLGSRLQELLHLQRSRGGRCVCHLATDISQLTNPAADAHGGHSPSRT